MRLGRGGQVRHWADIKHARHTYNARTEAVKTKPTFRNAFKQGQFCIIPANSFFEPNYETKKAVRWEIADASGEPLGTTGIWEYIWEYKKDGPSGLPLLSMSMLTINADGHPVMQRFHEENAEKRMVIILRPEQYDDWLSCPIEDAPGFFTRDPGEMLTAYSAPKPSRKSTQETIPDK